MSEVRDELRRVTDEVSAPIELDELEGAEVIEARPDHWPRRRLAAAAVAVGLVAGGVAVWGSSNGSEQVTAGPAEVTAAVSSPQARRDLEDFMLMRGASAGGIRMFETLGQLASGTAPGSPPSDIALVVGRVVDVESLAGYRQGEGDDEATTHLVDFEDPRAVWRSVVLEVHVDETLVGDVTGTIEVGFVIDSTLDLATARAALVSYGTVVLPLYSSVVFDHAPGVWGIVEDGELLMTMDADRRLAMPFKSPETAKTLLADSSTLDELRTQASKHPTN